MAKTAPAIRAKCSVCGFTCADFWKRFILRCFRRHPAPSRKTAGIRWAMCIGNWSASMPETQSPRSSRRPVRFAMRLKTFISATRKQTGAAKRLKKASRPNVPVSAHTEKFVARSTRSSRERHLVENRILPHLVLVQRKIDFQISRAHADTDFFSPSRSRSTT